MDFFLSQVCLNSQQRIGCTQLKKNQVNKHNPVRIFKMTWQLSELIKLLYVPFIA